MWMSATPKEGFFSFFVAKNHQKATWDSKMWHVHLKTNQYFILFFVKS
jgi:hypothetical protein